MMKLFTISIAFYSLFFSYSAFAGKDGGKSLNIKKLTDNVYQHISYKHVEPWGLIGASGLVIVNGNEAHMVDTPWTTQGTKQLIKWIETQNLILKSAVVTHFHEDASGDLPLLNDLNINTYASELTNKLLKQEQKETATEQIVGNSFQFIKNVADVFYPGAGHSQDNIVVWLPKEKLLFGGCFVKSLKSKGLGYTGDADIEQWPTSLQRVIERYPDIVTVVPGHGKIGDISLLTHTQALALSASSDDDRAN